MTITEAIKEAMRFYGGPMTIREAYDAIVGAGLYTFHAENPAHVVASQIPRHCKGVEVEQLPIYSYALDLVFVEDEEDKPGGDRNTKSAELHRGLRLRDFRTQAEAQVARPSETTPWRRWQ